MLKKIFALLILVAVVANPAFCRQDLWADVKKFPVPEYRIIEKGEAVSLIFAGEPYMGKETEVFAYYATPGTVSGKPELDKNLPAVVCVHGGGGTAFKEWVVKWAKAGYAAIAIDFAGNIPVVKDGKPSKNRLIKAGPDHTPNTVMLKSSGELKESWVYNAVANIARAHSLVRSFPEIDKDKTAVTGISWGGFLTCATIGVDTRFKAAVPVYGCGFIYESAVWHDYVGKMPSGLKELWVENLDPSNSLKKTTMPVLFINSPNDRWYPLNIWAKSAELPQNKTYKITYGMRHSHTAGWEPPEIKAFFDEILFGATPLPRVGDPTLSTFSRAKVVSKTKIEKAYFCFTTNTDDCLEARKWFKVPAQIEGGEVMFANNAPNVRAWYFYVEDERGLGASSKYAERTDRPGKYNYLASVNCPATLSPVSKQPRGITDAFLMANENDVVTLSDGIHRLGPLPKFDTRLRINAKSLIFRAENRGNALVGPADAGDMKNFLKHIDAVELDGVRLYTPSAK